MNRQRALADLLRKTADAIDQGTCTLTNAQASMIIDDLLNRPMSKEQASIYLGMERSSFDKAVRAGIIPRGRKVAGFGDGSWQIQASAEIRRVSELLTMATNGRRTKSSNTTV